MEEKKLKYSPKAYDNKRFLHSANGRTIRILAEYLEPQARLRQERIRGTIVFFGSSRAPSPEDLPGHIGEVQKSTRMSAESISRKVKSLERFSRYYSDAVRLAGMLTKHYQALSNPRDRHVICSGGGPGIMEAANRGAIEAGGPTIGLGISLPFEQDHNRFLDPRLAFEFHYFFMRKYWFIYLARALVIFPGGFGTMDELFEVLTLVQTKKVVKRLPIILYGREYWDRIVNFDAMVEWGVIAREDLKLIHRCDNPDAAFEILKNNIMTHSKPADHAAAGSRSF